MSTSSASPTTTEIIATASSVLSHGGYESIARGFPEWHTHSRRLFEDEYNVVGVAVFDTAAELLRSWPDLQSSLVEVISQHVGAAESKAWDGYLVLLTGSVAPSEHLELEMIRRDTTRLRKLVATGEDLIAAGDVERVLSALLPLRTPKSAVSYGSALDLLPELLLTHGISSETTVSLVRAFVDQKPLMTAFYRHGPSI